MAEAQGTRVRPGRFDLALSGQVDDGRRAETRPDVTARGFLGDRAMALMDTETGKVASAKNPWRWPNLFDFRAAYVEPPRGLSRCPPHGLRCQTARRDHR